MGGGYDSLFLDQSPPQTMPVTFAVGLLVPSEASGQPHHLQFAVLDEAGNAIAASEQLTLNVARPPGLPEWMPQRVLLAPLGGPVSFPVHGAFLLRVSLNGVHKTLTLSVVGREGGPTG